MVPQLINPQALGVAILELVTFSAAEIDLCSYFKVQSSLLCNAQLKPCRQHLPSFAEAQCPASETP